MFCHDIHTAQNDRMQEVEAPSLVEIGYNGLETYGVLPYNKEIVRYFHETHNHKDIVEGQRVDVYENLTDIKHHPVKFEGRDIDCVSCPNVRGIFKVGSTIRAPIRIVRSLHYEPEAGEIRELVPERVNRHAGGVFDRFSGLWSTSINFNPPGLSPEQHHRIRIKDKDWELIICPIVRGVFVVGVDESDSDDNMESE